ncbi:hypothetical protein C3941_10125 [Kaistia algarum]|uniref:YoaK family protein n=1 Tax=Kaistia algarum TaxID=2083279 RepID=UPI000CE8128F|nr:YoaK family protein [Kaistia algarum]MCX5512415.1 YoaK family protein [Kaistia algarum]PPE80495.1 hypothetical protein C3941_10125 [Kaistia algarum]
MRPVLPIAVLLGFNGGFVDTAGFLGLQGLFTSHVTGNFVTLAASLVLGTTGAVAKLLAIPVFIASVVTIQIADNRLSDAGYKPIPILFAVQAVLLAAFFGLAVILGPFPNGDAPAAVITGLVGVMAMSIQNAVQRAHLAKDPPTTILTGTTTQFAIDLADRLMGRSSVASAEAKRRFLALARAILSFGAGAMTAAATYHLVGLHCLAIAVIVAGAIALQKATEPPAETGMLM